MLCSNNAGRMQRVSYNCIEQFEVTVRGFFVFSTNFFFTNVINAQDLFCC